jgi:methane/ammonia monooxygenase subunit B
MAKAVLLGTLLLMAGAYAATENKYPNTVPLQAGRMEIEPLPVPAQQVMVKVKRAAYEVTNRVLAMTLEVTNNTAESVQLGEFNTATLRFINPQGGKPDPKYPKEIMAESGLTVDANTPIQAGETRVLQAIAKDAAWRTERLASITQDADSHFGGLAFFYNSSGGRYMTSISGPVVPVY